MPVKLVRFSSEVDPSGKIQNAGLTKTARIGARAALAGWTKYIDRIGGKRYDDICDHNYGQAIDIMKKQGCVNYHSSNAPYVKEFNQMARYFSTYGGEFGLYMMIWRSRIWQIGMKPGTWRPYNKYYNACTQGHWDHIHAVFCSRRGSCKPCGNKFDRYDLDTYNRPIPPTLADRKRLPKGVYAVGGQNPGPGPSPSPTPPAGKKELIVSKFLEGSTTLHSAYEVPLGDYQMVSADGVTKPEDDGRY